MLRPGTVPPVGDAEEPEPVVLPPRDAPAPAPSSAVPPAGPHRLRELDRRGRLVAAALALALVLVAVMAGVHERGWVPQGDDALISLRALDVGTGRTPLIGQPSTSGMYGEGADHVAHPGPAEFYLLAVPVRAFGPGIGSLVTTAAVSAACLLVIAWAGFRRAGLGGAAATAALGTLAAWSAGAAGMVDPLSSNAGRLPLLATAVLVWALVAGDLRLAPLAALFWSYTAQQHLSVLPASAVLLLAGAAACAWWTWRGDPDAALSRRQQGRWLLAALAAGLLLWTPVLLQQVIGPVGNLTALAGYSGDGSRENVGLGGAALQVSRVLGPRPLITVSGPTGWQLGADRPGLVVALVLVVALGLVAAIAWWRRRDRTVRSAAIVVGVLVVAGLVTGANVPDSPEQGRINFYHWAFALSFFQLFVLGAGLVALAGRRRSAPAPGRASGVVPALLAIAFALLVAIVPAVADRRADRIRSLVPGSVLQDLEEQLRADPDLAAVPGPVLVIVDGPNAFIQVNETVGVDLLAHGRDVRFQTILRGGVHEDHVADACDVDAALVLATRPAEGRADPPGRRIAQVSTIPGLDAAAMGRLEAAADGADVDLGPDLTRYLAGLGDEGTLRRAYLEQALGTEIDAVVADAGNVRMLLDHPPVSPALDPEDLEIVYGAVSKLEESNPVLEIQAYLVEGDELAELQTDCS